MKKACILLMTAAMAAACGGSSNNTTANNVVNSMNTNAANMRGANNNTGYVTNANSDAAPAMPRNATNISPPSVGNSNTHNSNNARLPMNTGSGNGNRK